MIFNSFRMRFAGQWSANAPAIKVSTPAAEGVSGIGVAPTEECRTEVGELRRVREPAHPVALGGRRSCVALRLEVPRLVASAGFSATSATAVPPRPTRQRTMPKPSVAVVSATVANVKGLLFFRTQTRRRVYQTQLMAIMG